MRDMEVCDTKTCRFHMDGLCESSTYSMSGCLIRTVEPDTCEGCECEFVRKVKDQCFCVGCIEDEMCQRQAQEHQQTGYDFRW